MSAAPLFDPGLQPERTELAWRRTALTLGVGSLVTMRVLPSIFDDAVWVIPGVVGVVFAGVLWVAAESRYRRANAALRTSDPTAALPDGMLLLALALFIALTGLLALAFVFAVVFAVPPLIAP